MRAVISLANGNETQNCNKWGHATGCRCSCAAPRTEYTCPIKLTLTPLPTEQTSLLSTPPPQSPSPPHPPTPPTLHHHPQFVFQFFGARGATVTSARCKYEVMLSNTWSLGRVLPPRLGEGLLALGPLNLVAPPHPHFPPMPGPILSPRSVPSALSSPLSAGSLTENTCSQGWFFSGVFFPVGGCGSG